MLLFEIFSSLLAIAKVGGFLVLLELPDFTYSDLPFVLLFLGLGSVLVLEADVCFGFFWSRPRFFD